MVRLKMVNLYKTENIPDHVIEELKALIMRLFKTIQPIAENTNSNLMISAMNHIMAMLVKMYISEDPQEIKKATLTLVRGFVGNVEFYTGVDPLDVQEADQDERS